MKDDAGVELTYREARAAHIRAAEQTESGRVKRPQGRIIGRLEFFKEPMPSAPMPWRRLKNTGILIGRSPALPGETRLTWAILPETRQMRRQQERREEAQRF